MTETGRPDVDVVPRRARRLVAVVVVLLLVPGLIGFEFWPLTGWRLFSLSRGDTANRWVVEGYYDDGSSRLIDFEELHVAYSNAEWPLRTIGGVGSERADEMCHALLTAAIDADDEVTGLGIARDAQRLVDSEDGWTVDHDLDVRHTCSVDDT